MKQGGIFILLLLLFLMIWGGYTLITRAAANIDATDHWAWSDTAGWWDFYGTNTVEVGTSTLHGYASSSIGEMVLNCDSSPSGNICGTSNFAVTNVEAGGSLSGCAWNDTTGWISFNCADYDCQGGNICVESNYQVTIDADGYFNNYAWNDIEGWISFNCANDSSCGTSDYKVRTSWRAGVLTSYLESSIIDTGKPGGVTLHSIIWQGSQESGSVDFQIATSSNSSGPWTYFGPGGSASAWYGNACPIPGSANPAAGENTPICVNKELTAGSRYLRYKVRLQSNTAQNSTPVVKDIILNWSE
ncbi:MAG TPA: hypothetical protein ENH86_01725 [Candidatus Jorgensenbacteria bacterium]|nr:hypothetical protein [Candidatus Jorgensenbacteria bacterium]